MYLPKHFEEADPAVLAELIERYPLGTWVLNRGAEVLINHVPFMIDEMADGQATRLLAHTAKANPVWQALAESGESVVVFQGGDAYISPSFYPSKQAHGKVVPTWNYAVVHVHGVARAVTERDELLALVTRLTETHEKPLAAPWQVSDAPDDYIEMMLNGIVGIELKVTRVIGKWKNSQNRSPEDRAGVAAALAGKSSLLPPT
ncbi:MAG: FMN-binding negative transcriptional regulator [Burkholderiaceae bacterium]